MNSANHPSTPGTAAMPATFGRLSYGTRRHRRPAPPPKDFNDLSSFEKIVLVCCIPAGAILWYLEDEEPTYRSFTADNMRFGLFQVAMLEAALGLCVGSVLWCLLKGIALLLRKVQRPKYYPQERMRRQALARERRRVRRRTTLNAAPTADELLAQWAKVKKNPEEMIRFGSMLCDLEAYVDNSLLRNENGEIVGRNPGIRGWLNANCQPLAVHYKTVMGYKAMAEKFRQAVGLSDPYPAAFALDDGLRGAVPTTEGAIRKNTVRKSADGIRQVVGDGGGGTRQNTVRKSNNSIQQAVGEVVDGICTNTVRKAVGGIPQATSDGRDGICQNMVRKSVRRKVEEMLAGCRRSQRSVRLALAARLSPDQVPPEVEREERRRQGLPPRDGLARRFVQMMA